MKLPRETELALLNGAKTFVLPIQHSIEPAYMATRKRMYTQTLIEKFSPYQIGDDVYVEEMCQGDCLSGLPCIYCGSSGQAIGSVKRIIGKIESIEVVTVADITLEQRCEVLKHLYNGLHVVSDEFDSLYGGLDYVFLYSLGE